MSRKSNKRLDPMAHTDGILVNRLHRSGQDSLTGVLTQPSQKLILERNAALRKENVQRDLSFGRQIASIPLVDYYALHAKYPQLNDRSDPKKRSQELIRILQMPEHRDLLVRDKI